MSKTLFIAGTGTEIGKTYISGLLVKKLLESGVNVGYYKAAMSGNDVGADGKVIPGDALAVKRLSGTEQSLESMCPFVYEKAVSPHLASKLEGPPFDVSTAKEGFKKVCAQYDYVVVEGSGGIVCPMRYDDNERLLLVDLIKEWQTPCLTVAPAGLGTINDVALTAWALEAREIPLRGLIFNYWLGGAMEEDNAFMCEELAKTKIVAKVAEGASTLDVDPETLKALFL
ncbi:MAG: dethiobiotin synthase [Thermoguttaceae bacterium]|jgi:dethiobiotin synthetase